MKSLCTERSVVTPLFVLLSTTLLFVRVSYVDKHVENEEQAVYGTYQADSAAFRPRRT